MYINLKTNVSLQKECPGITETNNKDNTTKP